MDALTMVYDGSDKAKELLCRMADIALAQKDDIFLEVTACGHKRRTSLQNRSLYKYFHLLADALNNAGYDQRFVLAKMRQGVEVPWTKESIKQVIWKPIQEALYNTDSTTELSTVEPDEVVRVIDRFLSDRLGGFVGPEWPSIESQMRSAA